MANSKKLNAMIAICDHLKAVTVANGYVYDVEGRVYRGRSVIDNETALPCIVVNESPQEPTENHTGFQNSAKTEEFEVWVQGFTTITDDDNPTDDAYEFAHDVEKHLARTIELMGDGSGREKYPNEYLFGRKVNSVKMLSTQVRPSEEGVSNEAFFYIPLRVKLSRV